MTEKSFESDDHDCDIDGDFMELARPKTKATFGVVYPDNILRAIWDISLFVTIIYQSIILPMRISFEFHQSDFMFYLEVVIDCMFLADIFFNFNTGFYFKGQLIMSRKAIFKDYMKQWFWIDLISSMPYTWLLAWSQGLGLREIEADD